jgi:hypothetical protein
MLSTIIALLIYSAFLTWFLRVDKANKYSKFTEITLSSRFLDTS